MKGLDVCQLDEGVGGVIVGAITDTVIDDDFEVCNVFCMSYLLIL